MLSNPALQLGTWAGSGIKTPFTPVVGPSGKARSGRPPSHREIFVHRYEPQHFRIQLVRVALEHKHAQFGWLGWNPYHKISSLQDLPGQMTHTGNVPTIDLDLERNSKELKWVVFGRNYFDSLSNQAHLVFQAGDFRQGLGLEWAPQGCLRNRQSQRPTPAFVY